MSNIFDEDAVASGLGEVDIQAMAKRQFVASAAAAIVIGLGVTPTSRDYANIANHKSWTAQQPRFVGRTADSVAVAKQQRQIELP